MEEIEDLNDMGTNVLGFFPIMKGLGQIQIQNFTDLPTVDFTKFQSLK